jgi:solute carrier family 8 (sodium/calcium exchanger)
MCVCTPTNIFAHSLPPPRFSFPLPPGNVTGSNAVNVFLGLGTPWLMATIYWATQGNFSMDTTLGRKWFYKYKDFAGEPWFDAVVAGGSYTYVSPAGDLGPSVATFTGLALCCVAVLMLRRKFAGGELGGPDRLRNVSAVILISFWFTYIAVSAAIAYTNCAAAGTCPT